MGGKCNADLAGETQSTTCRVGQLSRISGVGKQVLRRYDRNGLLHSAVSLESGNHLYTREDLIQLERLAVMQMLGLSRSQIKECLSIRGRDLRDELGLQRRRLLEKRRLLTRAIYFMEHAEMVNRDPQSCDWHYLGKVVEAIKTLKDPECFKRFYIYGTIHEDATPALRHKAQ